MITRENFEIYFIDYLDGQLPPSLQEELQLFLLVNPDLEELMHEVKDIRLTPPAEIYPHKEVLKKTADRECPDYYAIACAENVLTSSEKQKLGSRIRNKEFQALTEEYSRLRLQPDLTIRYEKKEKLYRKRSRLIPIISTLAATVLLLLGLGMWFFKTSSPEHSLTLSANRLPVAEQPVLPRLLKPEKITSASVHLPEKLHPVIPLSRKERILSEVLQPNEPMVPTVETESLASREVLVSLSRVSSPEIVLTDHARTWKSSSNNFQSKDIFRSFIQAGRTLAEKIRK